MVTIKAIKKDLHSKMFLSWLRNSPEDPGFWTEVIFLFSMTKLWALNSFSTSQSHDNIYTCSICHFILISISLAQVSEVFVHSDQNIKNRSHHLFSNSPCLLIKYCTLSVGYQIQRVQGPPEISASDPIIFSHKEHKTVTNFSSQMN